MINVFLIVILAYLLGSFPSSIVASKLFRGIDIRNFGSGNAGGTNSFRVLGWKLGLLVTVADIGKGAVATLFLSGLHPFPVQGTEGSPLSPFALQLLAGSAAIIGHIWTIFASFKGGKGVATAAGMLISLVPGPFLTILTLFFLVAGTTRYVSLASMTAMGALPGVLLAFSHWKWQVVPDAFIWFSVGLALLVVFTHRDNVKRLLQGKESKFRGHDPQSALKKSPASPKMDQGPAA